MSHSKACQIMVFDRDAASRRTILSATHAPNAMPYASDESSSVGLSVFTKTDKEVDEMRRGFHKWAKKDSMNASLPERLREVNWLLIMNPSKIHACLEHLKDSIRGDQVLSPGGGGSISSAVPDAKCAWNEIEKCGQV